jgi:Type IV secretion system pilin
MRTATLGKKIAAAVQALVLALGFGVASLAMAGPALAANACDPNLLTIDNGAQCAKADSAKDNLFAPNGIFATIANTLIFLVGAVAVIFLIIGGLRYVISNGDSKNVTAAKDTILYAIVGIVVAVISFALVQFVINALNKSQ